MEKKLNIPEEQDQDIILGQNIVSKPEGETEDPEEGVKPVGENLPEE
jgi:hypothetical protein